MRYQADREYGHKESMVSNTVLIPFSTLFIAPTHASTLDNENGLLIPITHRVYYLSGHTRYFSLCLYVQHVPH